MDLLTLLPLLLKVLPFAVIGVLYALWRRATRSRDRAKEERDSYQASYELVEETKEIDERGDKDVAKVEGMGLDGVIDALRGILRGPKPKG